MLLSPVSPACSPGGLQALQKLPKAQLMDHRLPRGLASARGSKNTQGILKMAEELQKGKCGRGLRDPRGAWHGPRWMTTAGMPSLHSPCKPVSSSPYSLALGPQMAMQGVQDAAQCSVFCGFQEGEGGLAWGPRPRPGNSKAVGRGPTLSPDARAS